jgi:Rrf2 family transcriptional regulator, iron-sulfur cluster assembly transcription factor
VLSQTSEYALKAVLYLADHDSAGPVRVSVIADALGIPQNYLSKTLHALVRSGVLASGRGPTGGFRLAREPHRVPLLDVVAPFDAITRQRKCLLGRPTCTDRTACAVHDAWGRTSEQVARFFRTTTVGDLLTPARVASRTTPSPRRPR